MEVSDIRVMDNSICYSLTSDTATLWTSLYDIHDLTTQLADYLLTCNALGVDIQHAIDKLPVDLVLVAKEAIDKCEMVPMVVDLIVQLPGGWTALLRNELKCMCMATEGTLADAVQVSILINLCVRLGVTPDSLTRVVEQSRIHEKERQNYEKN